MTKPCPDTFKRHDLDKSLRVCILFKIYYQVCLPLHSGVVQTLERVSYPLVDDFRDELPTGDASLSLEMLPRSLRRSSKHTKIVPA